MNNEDLAARVLARDALSRIELDDAYANLVVPAMLHRSELSGRDKRFVTELVYGSTRMRRAIDAALAPHLQRDIEAAVRTVLRLGTYQILFAGVAPHAAVSTTVTLAPKRAQGFVNAVMRRVSEAGPLDVADPATRLSYPDWIVQQLCEDLGDADGLAALDAMNKPSRPHVRDDGYVQDPASGWVAGLVDVEPGHRVADVCAAPGGKATALGHLVGGGLVVAADSRARRVELVAENAQTTGTAAVVHPIVADARTPPLRAGAFDRVLVDAPCSGLGVLHRRPDARWRIAPHDVAELAEDARRLLEASAPLVAPGGLMVYSVCTITAAETTGVGDWAASNLAGFAALAAPGGPWRPHGLGALLLPQVAGTDGMYVLRLRRSA